MAIEFDLIETSDKKYVGKTQVNTDCEINLEPDTEVGRILSVSGDATILNVEALSNELRYKGEVCFKVIYVAQNGKIVSVNCLNNFEGKIENNSINAFSMPIARATLIESKVTSVNNTSIKVNGLVETSVVVFNTTKYENEIDYKENLFIEPRTINYVKLIATTYDQVVVNTNLELEATPDAILSTNARVVITNVTTGTEYYAVEGKIAVNVVYSVLVNDRYNLKNQIKVFDFKEEVENANVNKNSLLEVFAKIKNCTITTELTENNNLNINLPLDLSVVVLEKNMANIPLDAYHTTNNITFEMESLNALDNVKQAMFTERIDGQILFNDEEYRLNEIFGTCGENVIVTNTYVEDDNVHIEGIAYANVIYSLDDETEQMNSVQAEMPFTLTFRVEGLLPNDQVTADVEILDIDVRQKKGREINFDVLLGVEIYVETDQTDALIKKINVLDLIDFNEGNLQIYLAHTGDTLWDIAKNLLVDPDVVLSQNPDLVFPLNKDEKIVLYSTR